MEDPMIAKEGKKTQLILLKDQDWEVRKGRSGLRDENTMKQVISLSM